LVNGSSTTSGLDTIVTYNSTGTFKIA
jgi:hypothetical protein